MSKRSQSFGIGFAADTSGSSRCPIRFVFATSASASCRPEKHGKCSTAVPTTLPSGRLPRASRPSEPRGAILRGDGNGQLATRQTYRDFVLHLYIRGVAHHNGGVMFRSIPQTPTARSQSYEIQLHDVEGAHYATGSLYSIKRSVYPRIEPEKWFLFQLVAQGPRCLVRINGENVLEYEGLQNLEPGRIELQAHDPGRWIEYKEIKIRRL